MPEYSLASRVEPARCSTLDGTKRVQKEPGLLQDLSVRAVRRSGLYHRERILTVYEQELLKLTMSVK